MLSNIITNLICSTAIIPENKALKATFELALDEDEEGSRHANLLICNHGTIIDVYVRESADVSYKDNSFPRFVSPGLWFKMQEKTWDANIESFFSYCYSDRIYCPDPFKKLFELCDIPVEVLNESS